MLVTHQMLDLSLGHLSPETLRYLDEQDNGDVIPSVILFGKDTYGYFVPIIEDELEELEERGYPEDLINVIRFAAKQGCSWIMLDVDGAIVEELPFWSDGLEEH